MAEFSAGKSQGASPYAPDKAGYNYQISHVIRVFFPVTPGLSPGLRVFFIETQTFRKSLRVFFIETDEFFRYATVLHEEPKS